MVKFLKLRSEVFIATLIDALCLHFVIPVAEIVLSFPDKKSKFPQLLLLPGSCPKSARSAPDNVLRVLQISSKWVHFQQSYCRTRVSRYSLSTCIKVFRAY